MAAEQPEIGNEEAEDWQRRSRGSAGKKLSFLKPIFKSGHGAPDTPNAGSNVLDTAGEGTYRRGRGLVPLRWMCGETGAEAPAVYGRPATICRYSSSVNAWHVSDTIRYFPVMLLQG